MTQTKPKLNATQATAIRMILRANKVAFDEFIYQARLGREYGQDRNIYTALGYKVNLDYADFLGQYRRQGVARKVINAWVNASWRKFPKIEEAVDEDTPFEGKVKDLVKELKLQNRFVRLDRQCSVGKFAVLFLGFKDGLDPSVECTRANELLFVQPYSESATQILTWETDKQSPRFGLPVTYSITMRSADGTMGSSITVHWSRIIHVAQDCLDNDIEGTPQLEGIFNDLKNLEKVAGGSAEMFWRGAFPGYVFKMLDGATLSEEDEEKMTAEIKKYLNNLQRIIRTANIDVQPLTPQVADPGPHIDKYFELIAAGSNIPVRILKGSERGELASSQDDDNWNIRVAERQEQHCEANIIRPFIDRLIDLKLLELKTKEYTVEWESSVNPSEKDKADVSLTRTQALVAYANSPGAQDVVPPETWLSEYANLTDDQIEVIAQQLVEAMKEANAQDPPPPAIDPTTGLPVAPANQPPVEPSMTPAPAAPGGPGVR